MSSIQERVNVVGCGKRRLEGIYGGRGLVGGGLKLEDVWVVTFPMVIVVRVKEINLGSVKRTLIVLPAQPLCVCAWRVILSFLEEVCEVLKALDH